MKKISKIFGIITGAVALSVICIVLVGCGGPAVSGTYKFDLETTGSADYGSSTYALRIVYDCDLVLNEDKTFSYTYDFKIYIQGVSEVKVHNLYVWEGKSYTATETENEGVYNIAFSDYTRVFAEDEDSEDYTGSQKTDFINENKMAADRVITIDMNTNTLTDSSVSRRSAES